MIGLLAIPAAAIAAYYSLCYVVVLQKVPIPRTPVVGLPSDVGLQYEDVNFRSMDGVNLSGWLIRGSAEEAGAEQVTVIVVNGAKQNRNDADTGTLNIAKDLADKGINVLLFDLKGRGLSEGKGAALANNELDIGGAVNFVRERYGGKVALLGFSLGAAASINYASKNDVNFVISDCCYSNVNEMFAREAARQGFPQGVARMFTGTFISIAHCIYGSERVNPVDIVTDVDCPILFIHGSADERIPYTDSAELYNVGVVAGRADDELVVVAGAMHTQSYKTDPVSYIDNVAGFVGK